MATVVLAVFGFGPSAAGEEGEARDPGRHEVAPLPDDRAPPIPEKREQAYPRLGSGLDRLVTEAGEGQASVRAAADGAVAPHAGALAVTIHLSGNVDGVVSFLEEHGGDPRNVGEDYIEAYVSLTLLGRVSQQAGVVRVRELVAAHPDQSPLQVAGHGPRVHGAAAWNQTGYAGQGVKVGIIDGGFKGLGSLMGTELPATVVARCYTEVGVFTHNLADCEAVRDASVGLPFAECGAVVQRRAVSNAEHGTIVAEAIADIAPDVSLYIANPRSWADMQDAVEWMASEGVAVINQSQGWILDGPGDGTSLNSSSPLRTVDLAVARDITWVNSAGNGARNTWFGAFEDPDRNRAIGFGGANDEVLDLSVQACGRYTVQLRWEDSWAQASSDLDLYLVHKPSGRSILLGSGRDQQSGAPGDRPFEWLSFWSRTDSDDLGVAVYHHDGDAPEWIQLVVWGTASIEHYTRSGSIGNPAESANPGLLAVGAAHWDDVRAIEPYSSRGPAPDGRIKPDIVGADCGATALEPLDEYSQGFCGTSQAAPHVAGMAALVRQRFPGYTAAQVAGYLKDTARQRQSPDPNNTWGHGFAELPPPDGSASAAPAPYDAFTRTPVADFETLSAALNLAPQGIWSDGTTMWVADPLDAKLYAYDAVTGTRAPGRDSDALTAAGNTSPTGIWSDGTTMWVADWLDAKLYAYDMASRARVTAEEFNTLEAAGNDRPQGIWSDGTTMWVADILDDKLYAYDMETKARAPGADFVSMRAARNGSPRGIWSDGTTMWVADSWTEKVYAYDLATRSRDPGRELNTLEAAGNLDPRGIWSDGTTMWVADFSEGKLYAYSVDSTNQAPAFAEAATARMVAENTAPGVDIGAPVRASDPDGDTLTYSLGGADSGSFGIDSRTGQLTTSAALDHETKAGYEVTVTAEDPSGLRASIDVTVTVTDEDEAPALSGDAPVGYAENGTDPVATYSAADPEGGVIAWSLSGEDEGHFTIAAGALAFAAFPDYEAPADADTDNVYRVTVVAADPSGLRASIDVAVTVTDEDEAPTLSGDAPVGYAENGTDPVATYSATDPEGGAIAWSLSGEDEGDFTIAGGVLAFAVPPDYEAPADADTDNAYHVTVVAADPSGLRASIDVAVTVTDEDEAPVLIGDAAVGYAEHGTDPVATYSATDPEGGAIAWSLSGEDEGDFTIGSGVLAFAVSPDYEVPVDADMDNAYQVTVVAADPSGLSDSIAVTVTVTDVEETAGQTLLERYDADQSGAIERAEMFKAIDDYLFGTGDDAISNEDMIDIINLYLFG